MTRLRVCFERKSVMVQVSQIDASVMDTLRPPRVAAAGMIF